MKKAILLIFCSFSFGFAQNQTSVPSTDWKTAPTLTQTGAVKILLRATSIAETKNKKFALAVLDASGNVILMTLADGVGPHNLEAARRKAFTAVSTKTPTLLLARNANSNSDTQNLNTLPELLLLGGGAPIILDGQVIGSVGIAGAGGPEQDDAIAQDLVTLFNK